MAASLHVTDAKSTAVRKRIENHQFQDEEGEEYKASHFGGFTEYFRRKKIKLQNLDAELRATSQETPPIFRGVVAHVNGYTQPSLSDLHKLIVTHGGGFLQYLDGKTTVTHIIASSLTLKKRIEFRRYRIVKPAWVVESIKAGKLLPWNEFRVVDEGQGQKVLGFDNGKVVSQKNDQQTGYKDQTDGSWYTGQLMQTGEELNNLEADPSGFLSQSSPIDAPLQFGGELSLEFEVPPSGQADFSSCTAPAAPQSTKEDAPLNDVTAEVGRPTSADGDQVHKGTAQSAQGPAAIQSVKDLSPEDFPDEPEFESDTLENLEFEIAAQLGNETREEGAPSGSNPLKRSYSSDLSVPSKQIKMSAEEHNSLLLTDPHIRKSSAVNPDFIRQYYAESRLHHLSSWKAELKAQLQRMTAEQSSSQKTRQKRSPGARRYILHVDFDSFFAAVSLKSAPQYRDKPVVVAHGSGSGSEIASCNYPAREFGVKNGMWMKNALKLCPHLNVLPYDFKGYEEVSKQFYNAILETGGIVQSVSVDEALVDVTMLCLSAGGSDGTGIREGSIWREQEKAEEIARHLRDQIKDVTDCNVSVGIGANILLAKLALRKAKPAGQYLIKPEEVVDYIGELTVQDLPGVAHSIGGKVEEIGVKFVKDVRNLSKEKLVSVLGPKTGEKIWEYSRGIDRVEVGEQSVRKSVSAEVNWGIRFETQAQADEFVTSLCGELHKRLVEQKAKGKQLTMKIMRRAADAPLDPPKHLGHGKCDVFNRSAVLGVATNAQDILARESLSILRAFGFGPGELRGIGLQMTRLEPLKNNKEGEGETESSQKRLQFKAADPKRGNEQGEAVAVLNDAKTSPQPARTRKENGSDRKQSTAVGTQFAVPTQIDPSVLAELPEDIRSKLVRSQLGTTSSSSMSDRLRGTDRQSLTTFGTQFAIPAHIDPSVLAELPEYIRSKLVGSQLGTTSSSSISDRERGNDKQPPTTSGTQFAVPTQIDLSVLAELPEDIRSKLARPQLRANSTSSTSDRERIRSNSPNVPPSVLPTISQLDQETLAALPENVIQEVLAAYKEAPNRPQNQGLLPQSPRKNRQLAPTAKKHSTPTKRRTKTKLDTSLTTLTQANFVTKPTTNNDHSGAPSHEDGTTQYTDEISASFLAALPDDIRREVLAEQKRERLKRRSNLKVTRPSRAAQRSSTTTTNNNNNGGQRWIQLPPRPPKATFTTAKLSTLPELRGAISAWVSEFAEDGPYDEDVAALAKYLVKVVGGGKEMHKAVAVVRWLDWVAGEHERIKGRARQAWDGAVERVREEVQRAVRERRLGEVQF
ncbi:MAG: deoxycytidyl transferase [Peltula sp. TS41687]|nr:MAG: deoxycytidyl transferase [Peltula sp. TS41687]